MNSKFQKLNFGSVAVLSKEQQRKVKGGAYGNSSSGGGNGACIVSVTCTYEPWFGNPTSQWFTASASSCSAAYGQIHCGSWTTYPGPCTCTK
jgi:hypothetical protein